jgi:hypothetical protein
MDNVVYTCSTILVFATDTDVDAWSQRHAILRGDVQPIQRVYDFARVARLPDAQARNLKAAG